MLIGDPDQAIYEWNDAKPDLFIEKFNSWKDNSVILNENRRSSNNLCRFTYHLSSLISPSEAVTVDVKDCVLKPSIVTYDANNLQKTITDFLDLCKQYQIETTQENTAVLYRSNGFYHQIIGNSVTSQQENPWILGKIHIKEGFSLMERALFKALSERNYCSEKDIAERISEEGFLEYRNRILKIIQMLPKTNIDLVNWINQTNQTFKTNGINIQLEIESNSGIMTFDNLFETSGLNSKSSEYRLGTIHTAKGETFDAVLLFLKKKAGQRSNYATYIKNNTSITSCEELRIVYVGMTRPRKLLMLAVPDENDKKAWERKMLRNGD